MNSELVIMNGEPNRSAIFNAGFQHTPASIWVCIVWRHSEKVTKRFLETIVQPDEMRKTREIRTNKMVFFLKRICGHLLGKEITDGEVSSIFL